MGPPYPIERTAVVPLPLDETWEAFFGNEMRNWAKRSEMVVEVREYQMRADGTPEYVMVNELGPLRTSHRSDYVVYDPPTRSVDRTLDSLLEGRFVVEHEPVDDGTRVTHRFEVEPRGPMRLLFPVIRPLFARTFQQDLDVMVDRIADSHPGARDSAEP